MKNTESAQPPRQWDTGAGSFPGVAASQNKIILPPPFYSKRISFWKLSEPVSNLYESELFSAKSFVPARLCLIAYIMMKSLIKNFHIANF